MPGKLSGKWSSPDGMDDGSISASIDPATSKGTLSAEAPASHCDINNAAITATMDGDKLVLKVDPSYVNSCRSDISVVLTRKGDSYEGQLHQDAIKYNLLDVKMSPQ